jgi:hypothetical protein
VKGPKCPKGEARDRWQVTEQPVSRRPYLTGDKVSPGYIEVRWVCHGDGAAAAMSPSPNAATPDPPRGRASLLDALHRLSPLDGAPLLVAHAFLFAASNPPERYAAARLHEVQAAQLRDEGRAAA